MIRSVTQLKNPYPGLRAFEEGDAEYFFGRDRHVDELLLRLRNHRFVAVLGLSGSGKSSLVRAGLIPALKTGHLTTSGSRWRVSILRPGSQPLAALAAAIDETLGAKPNRLANLYSNSNALLLDTRVGREPDESLLVVVDQFEEVFRVSNPREAAHFVDLLLATEQDLSPLFRVYLVLTMRTDRLGECARFEGLPEALNTSQYLVPKLTNHQLREAIEGPAALTETMISPELVQKLVTEAAQGRDQLPLLQHLLMTLWESRETARSGSSVISLAQYNAVRSPSDALNDHADRVLTKLSKGRQYLVSLIFRALTEAGESGDQRRPQRLSELSAATVGAATSQDVQAIVEDFYDATFLTSPDRGRTSDWQVDITHESLIRQWKKLAGWVAEEVKDADDYRYFSTRARRGADPLSGVDLELALEWLKKGHNEAWAVRYRGDFDATVQYIRRSEEIRVQAEHEATAKLTEKLIAQELAQAAEIQRDLLPAKAPNIAGYDLAGLIVPCHTVGGDYYDFLPYKDGRLGIVVGDVSGKGMGAALLMSSVQGRVQMLQEVSPDPAWAVTTLNRNLTARCPVGRFITFFYALLDPLTGTLEYSNASYNYPLLLRANGEVEQLAGSGLVMGLFATSEYAAEQTMLESGDILALYSDGVTEACTPAGAEFGERGLAKFLAAHRTQPCEEIIQSLTEELRAWCNDALFADDFTIVLVRRN